MDLTLRRRRLALSLPLIAVLVCATGLTLLAAVLPPPSAGLRAVEARSMMTRPAPALVSQRPPGVQSASRRASAVLECGAGDDPDPAAAAKRVACD